MEEARRLASVAQTPSQYVADVIVRHEISHQTSTIVIARTVLKEIRQRPRWYSLFDTNGIVQYVITECPWAERANGVLPASSTRDDWEDVFCFAMSLLHEERAESIRPACFAQFTPEVMSQLLELSIHESLLMEVLRQLVSCTSAVPEYILPLFSDDHLFIFDRTPSQRYASTPLVEFIMRPMKNNVFIKTDQHSTPTDCMTGLRYFFQRMPRGFLSRNMVMDDEDPDEHGPVYVLPNLLLTLRYAWRELVRDRDFVEHLFEELFNNITADFWNIVDKPTFSQFQRPAQTTRHVIHEYYPSMIYCIERPTTAKSAFEE